MKLIYKTIMLAVLVLVMPVAADEIPTEVMVVTAKRLPTDTNRLSGSVSVITAEQIERRQYRVLSDALRDIPGLSAPASGGIGAQTSVFIRGTESDHVLILIDGVEVTDPAAGNRYEFAQLSLNGVERIEVLRGNYSAEYGSEALGGIINIITRTPTENDISAQVETGSFDRHSGTIDIDAVYKSLDFSLSGRYFETDGESFTPSRIRRLNASTIQYEERDGYRNNNVKVNAGLLLVPETNTKLSMKSEYSQTNLEYDRNDCEDLELEQSSYTKRTTFALSGNYFDGIWNPIWRMDYYESDRHERNVRNSCDSLNMRSERYKGERFKLNWHNVWQPRPSWDIAFGVETELEQAHTDGEFDASARTNALYTELRYTPTPDWHLNVGWRNDDSDDFASERSYQVGAVLHANLNTRLHFNYATAFRAPSLIDRFRDFPAFNFSANPNLKPETSRGWEVGIEQNWLRWRYGFTYFNTDINDLIVYTFNPIDFTSTLINQDQARIDGLEGFITFRADRTFVTRLDYTQTSAHDQSNQRLLRRPLRQAVLSIDYDPDEGALAGWSFDMTLNYRGPQSDGERVSFAPISKGGYTLANLNLNYTINDRLKLYGGINNLFDKSHEPIDGYQGTGINAHIGLSLR